jgi:tellurite resistance protein TerC
VGWAPHIPIWLSLLVIIGTLGVATVASLMKTSRDKRRGDLAPETRSNQDITA